VPLFPLGDRKGSLSLKFGVSLYFYITAGLALRIIVCVCVALEGLCVKSVARYENCLTFS
jgi:hypothetical protein